MNVKEEFLKWMGKSRKYLGSPLEIYLDKYSTYLEFDPFEIEDDYSNIEAIKNNIKSKDNALKNNAGYVDFQTKSGNGVPRALLGNENYFAFLNEIKQKAGKDIFKDIIKELENKFKKDNIFKVTKLEHNHAWIGDLGDIIGNQNVHYEALIIDTNKVTVDIHFEGSRKEEFHLKFNNQIQLPQNVIWFRWPTIRNKTNSQSIRYNKPIDILDNQAATKINEQLIVLEEKFGKKIREFLGHSEFKINKTTIPMEQYPLNQILFGPPGTGKTYNTINKALEIIGEDVELESKTRKEIKESFDAKMFEGRIVFTTFHQSMSYEDFIEGIKPVEPKQEGQPVNYKVIDGIFKRACAIAGYHCYKLFIKSKNESTKYSFDSLYDDFIDDIKKQLKNIPPIYKTLRGRDIEVKEINTNDSIIARAKNSVATKSAPLTKENLQKLYDKFKTINEIVDLKQIEDTIQISTRITEFYAVFQGLLEFEKSYKPDEKLINEINEVEVIDYEEIQKKFNARVYNEAIKIYGKNAEPVIFIIDEINRGNVSQIFGELITLIEEDKRLGKEEALEVILPYSKDKFGVPPNLYIIGTMNTADRSVEALDAALRRRFCFKEMQPKPELLSPGYRFWNLLWQYKHVGWNDKEYKEKELEMLIFLGASPMIWKEKENIWNKFKKEGKAEKQAKDFPDSEFSGIDLEKLLRTINQRIEKLLDKDHQIGHSYFMAVLSLEKLKRAFQNNIIPLLQEYFFGDYGKIGLVIGRGFFETLETQEKFNFSEFPYDDSSEFASRTIYKLKDLSIISDDDFKKAINLLKT